MATDWMDGGEGDELVWSLYEQGQARLQGGEPAAAAEVLELAVEREPHKASLREALGRAYYAASRVEPARAQFQSALDLNPSDDYAHFGLGCCLERQGRLPDAAKHFKLAVALSDRAEYRQALGRVLSRLGIG
jgi:Flp pilus assembly protein TadD